MATAGDIQLVQSRVQIARPDDESVAAGNVKQAPIVNCRSKSRRAFSLFYFLVGLIVAYSPSFWFNCGCSLPVIAVARNFEV